MITYEDLLARFAKVAEDRLGSGGVLPSQAEVNSAQNAPSHDAKEKADLPTTEAHKHTFDSGKCVKGPEEPKVNKNVFMTRTKDSTIKQAFEYGLLDELSKHGFSMPEATTQKVTTHSKVNPSGRGGFMTVKKFPHLSVAKKSSAAGFKALPKAKGPNPLLASMKKGAAEAFMHGFLDELQNHE